MDFEGLKDKIVLISILISVVIIYLVLHFVVSWIISFTGWDYILTFVLLFGGLCVGAILFGFFLIPGGEWFWKKKETENQ